MSSFTSRVFVAAILLPLVIGLVYLGGWWLLGLGLVAGLAALHELYSMARELRPLVLGGYLGFGLALLGLQLGGLPWMAGGIVSALVFSFVIFGLSDVRPSATTSFGVTLLGVVWVGGGIGFLLLVRDIPEYGFWATMAVLFAVFAADTDCLLRRARVRAPQDGPGDLAREVLGGFRAEGVVAAMATAFVILTRSPGVPVDPPG